jgi:hypothetical protein
LFLGEKRVKGGLRKRLGQSWEFYIFLILPVLYLVFCLYIPMAANSTAKVPDGLNSCTAF